MDRQSIKQALSSEEWDVLIIGGGATGLGVALDAASRGLKTALIEQKDYANGPSSNSTKLVHGGVRYLEKAVKELDWGQYKLVKEALNERQTMLQLAPHLVKPIPFIIPVFSTWEKFYYKIGTWLYDKIAGKDDFPNAIWLSKSETLKAFPYLNPNKLKGSILYYDGQFNDAFYATALLRTAILQGANCLNYMKLVSIQPEKNKVFCFAHDKLTDERLTIIARCVINCAGVNSDEIRLMAQHDKEKRLRPSQGIHIVLPRNYLDTEFSLLIPSTEDGRVVFVIPWYYGLLIGTTDTEVKNPTHPPSVSLEDIDYLIRQVQPYLSKKIQRSDIQGYFSGYRPLVKDNRSRTEALIRNHEIEVIKQARVIHVLGGKWTTYRQMAEEAVDAAFELLSKPKIPCKTKSIPLIGHPSNNQEVISQPSLPKDIIEHLKNYGSEQNKVLEFILTYGSERIIEGYAFTVGEMVFLLKHAQMETVSDFLFRGTRLGIIDCQAAKQAAPVLHELLRKFHTNYCEKSLAWFDEDIRHFIPS